MGHRNPDRVPMAIRRQRCETVERMRRDAWDVISRCGKCGLIMRVDLGLVIRVSGPSTSLWNRKARCRRLGCSGWVEFQARAPGMSFHEPLSAPPVDV
ncbi:MAG: hypothetical protein ABI906_06980 [Pseudomonadota bacterium]